MTNLDLTSYDYKTIETALDIEHALKLNPNATFTDDQISMAMDAIMNTTNPYSCDIICDRLEIKEGYLIPTFFTEVQCDESMAFYRERERRAEFVAEEGSGCAFETFDEIREYMNDGAKTTPLIDLLIDSPEFEFEIDDDSEDLEIEIDEHVEPEYETVAQTSTEPQTDAKTERKGFKTMIKNLFDKLKPVTTECILDQGVIAYEDSADLYQLIQVKKGKKLKYITQRTSYSVDDTKQITIEHHNFEQAMKFWGNHRTSFDE